MEHELRGSQGFKQWGQHNKAYPPRSQVSLGNPQEWNNGGQPKEVTSALEMLDGGSEQGDAELIPLV